MKLNKGSELDTDSQVAKILKDLGNVDLRDERKVAERLLGSKLAASPETKMVGTAALSKADIPEGTAPIIETMVGERFIKFDNGNWYGVGGELWTEYGNSKSIGKRLSQRKSGTRS